MKPKRLEQANQVEGYIALFGMPLIRTLSASTCWDDKGNYWTRLTDPDNGKTVMTQVVSIEDPRTILDLPERQADKALIAPPAVNMVKFQSHSVKNSSPVSKKDF